MVPMLSAGIDHLIYAGSSLDRGMDEIERLLGVRPVPGGRHPLYGTHNALLSLGPATYLEVIARDPGLPVPERGALIDIPSDQDSRLVTWVLRSDSIEQAAATARDAGIELGPVERGSRTAPDGSELSWQLTDPYAMPADGAIPFLIDWGTTIHPAGVAPRGGELVELRIEHPEADGIRHALSLFGADVEVVRGDKARLSAKIQTDSGPVVLS